MDVTEFLRDYRGFIDKSLLFAGILVLGGVIARILLRKVVFAFDLSAKGDRSTQKKGTRVWLAFADLAGWLFAFLIATEVVGLDLAMRFFTVTIIIATIAVFGVIITGLLAYSFNKEANELILSVIAYWYLKPGKNKPFDTREYDLGEGKQGKISEIALLHTTFRLNEGGTETRSNAFLMRRLWGFGKMTRSEKTNSAG
jgi:hypothetical protein